MTFCTPTCADFTIFNMLMVPCLRKLCYLCTNFML